MFIGGGGPVFPVSNPSHLAARAEEEAEEEGVMQMQQAEEGEERWREGGGGEERGHLPKNRFSLLLLSFPLTFPPSGRHNNRSRRAADPCQPPLASSIEGPRLDRGCRCDGIRQASHPCAMSTITDEGVEEQNEVLRKLTRGAKIRNEKSQDVAEVI